MSTRPVDGTTLARALAEWIVALRWDDVPAQVKRSTIESTFQSVAGGVAGLDTPEMRVALAWARAAGETGAATILGDGAKVPLSTAVFVNSVLWCSLEQQEMHVPSRTHPHEVIVPVAITLAEQLHVDGVTLLESILAGVEVTTALGKTAVEITPEIVRGMPSNSGVVVAGVAAAAAKLLGFDVATTALALAHAAQFGSGLSECLRRGTTEYHYTLANASAKGVFAAQLAAAGAEAALTQFEGGSGLFTYITRMSGEQLLAADLHGRVVRRLGTEWGMPEHIYKRYPVHFPSMPYLDGAKKLREQHGIRHEDIESIRLKINAWIELCDGENMGPYTGREATRGAVAFQVATMLVKGRYGLDEVEVLDDPAVMKLVSRTTIDHYTDPTNDCWQWAEIEITDKQGNAYRYDSLVEGIPDYRLPMSELRPLAEDALGRILGAATTTRVLDLLVNLETCEDVAAITPLLVRPS